MYILYIGRDYPPQFIPGSTGSTGIKKIIWKKSNERKRKKGEKVEFYRKPTVCTKYERNINLIDDIYIYIYQHLCCFFYKLLYNTK